MQLVRDERRPRAAVAAPVDHRRRLVVWSLNAGAQGVVREAERQAGDIDRQWRLRRERAQYEARLCQRLCRGTTQRDIRSVSLSLKGSLQAKPRQS
jgi:hypothetical protein